jgi:hypothetical protein
MLWFSEYCGHLGSPVGRDSGDPPCGRFLSPPSPAGVAQAAGAGGGRRPGLGALCWWAGGREQWEDHGRSQSSFQAPFRQETRWLGARSLSAQPSQVY